MRIIPTPARLPAHFLPRVYLEPRFGLARDSHCEERNGANRQTPRFAGLLGFARNDA
jgi:hypothetical protein